MTTNEPALQRTPAYEELEQNIDNIILSANRCERTLRNCVDGYVSIPTPVLHDTDDEMCEVENNAVINRLNLRMQTLQSHLSEIDHLSTMLNDELPSRITGMKPGTEQLRED